MVPIVEPEILMDGDHSAEDCERVTARVYDIMFQTLRAFRVHLPGCVMKTAMVLPGKQGDHEMHADEVAERTVRVLKNHVPAELGGVVFLSGGQSTGQALVNLNRIEQKAKQENLPFDVTFSYLRSLQDPALNHWAKDQSDVAGAQEVLNDLLTKASDARNGVLDESTLHPDHVSGNKESGFWEY
jgi:fructose-bisphosphate aldolase class I